MTTLLIRTTQRPHVRSEENCQSLHHAHPYTAHPHPHACESIIFLVWQFEEKSTDIHKPSRWKGRRKIKNNYYSEKIQCDEKIGEASTREYCTVLYSNISIFILSISSLNQFGDRYCIFTAFHVYLPSCCVIAKVFTLQICPPSINLTHKTVFCYYPNFF